MRPHMVFDPLARKMVRLDDCRQLQEADRYVPVFSPEVMQWFALHSWSGDTCRLDDVDTESRAAVDRRIEEAELHDELLARCGQVVEDHGRNPPRVSISHRHDASTIRRVFSAVVSEGFTVRAVHFAYSTLDQLYERAMQAPPSLTVTDSAQITESR